MIKKDGKTLVVEMRKATGTFYETLELNDFPVGKNIIFEIIIFFKIIIYTIVLLIKIR